MVLTHLIFFFFDAAAVTPPDVSGLVAVRGINDVSINALRNYSFGTGEINGPILSWDEYPLTVSATSPVWSVIGAISTTTQAAHQGINDVAINASRNYLFGTGDISGPILVWDEIPQPPTSTVWNQP